MTAILAILFAIGFVAISATPVQEVRYIWRPSQCPEDPKIIPPGTFNLTLHPLFDQLKFNIRVPIDVICKITSIEY